ncbi:hypothetical protein PWT90_10503 [Aphanocladium album]|nr:hypothetical protein PWT90_10503 [Aphanocladium album]
MPRRSMTFAHRQPKVRARDTSEQPWAKRSPRVSSDGKDSVSILSRQLLQEAAATARHHGGKTIRGDASVLSGQAILQQIRCRENNNKTHGQEKACAHETTAPSDDTCQERQVLCCSGGRGPEIVDKIKDDTSEVLVFHLEM